MEIHILVVELNVFNMPEREGMIQIKEKKKKLLMYVVILLFVMVDTNFESLIWLVKHVEIFLSYTEGIDHEGNAEGPELPTEHTMYSYTQSSCFWKKYRNQLNDCYTLGKWENTYFKMD